MRINQIINEIKAKQIVQISDHLSITIVFGLAGSGANFSIITFLGGGS
jgi:hypothetical protein